MAINMEDARMLLSEARAELMSKPNVVATGLGYKISAGKRTDELALICSVEFKRTKQMLSAGELIPAGIQNVATDVLPTGLIYALQEPTEKFRPAPGGVSIGHYLITAGTLGCYVTKNNKKYILSNNHVLANSNDGQIGDAIYQPGPHDGGTSTDQIATLNKFIHIQFEGGDNGGGSSCSIGNFTAAVLNTLAALTGSKTRLQAVLKPKTAENLVDCALAEPLDKNDVLDEIFKIGKIAGVTEATLNMNVKKSGRTTGLTTGSITQIDVTSRVSYGTNKTALFVDQLMAGAMSAGGDSGSVILTDDNKLIGLLFAGSSNTTIFNRIQNVFSALEVVL